MVTAIRNAFAPGGTVPWIVGSSAVVNAYCFYWLERVAAQRDAAELPAAA